MKRNWVHIIYSGLGGTTDYIFNLIEGDEEKRINHHIVFYGVEEVPKKQMNYAKEIADVSSIIKRPGRDSNALVELKKDLEKINIDVLTLHVNSLIFDKAKWCPDDTELLFVEHQANHLKAKKEWFFSILAQKNANRIISLTEQYQESLKKKLKFLYRSNKNDIIKTGINIDVEKVEKDNILRITMISRINEFRDHSTLIKAFIQLKNKKIELHIAGDGPSLNSLKTEFQEKNIHFHGLLDLNMVQNLLSRSSIYVQASFGETSSLAIMQAQASGLPIIASDVAGINNILNTENTILVQTENVLEMKNALELLVSNKNKRESLSQASLSYAKENLDRKRMFQDYKNLIG